jgi:putative phosphoesterase
MIAIISDVHGNLAALQAVLAEAGRVQTVYCAGDIVGYGPEPNECCELIRQIGAQCVRGNHDHICATLEGLGRANPLAMASFSWTNRRLTAANKEWLLSLPLQLSVNNVTMVHGAPGSPREMLNTYVLERYYDEAKFEQMLRSVPGKRLVLGHTHLPMAYGYNGRILNPGSVGQPRDGDWRPSFVTVQNMSYRVSLVLDPRASFSMLKDRVRFRRVEYDREATAAKIEREEGLPDTLAQIVRDGGLKI